MNIFQTPAFLWAIAIVSGVIVAIVVLTEIADRLKRAQHPLASIVQMVRNIVLLLIAIFLMQRMVMNLSSVSLSLRLVSTAMWAVAIVVIIRLSNYLLRDRSEPTWHDNIPRLVKRLPVYLVVVFVVAYVLQGVWGLPITQYTAALGVGSVVIALALQDTFSNLVSGLFILFNRPFAEGEWIHVGDVEGKVLTVNWRYTSIETRNGDLILFPNGSLAQESITNHSQPYSRTRTVQPIVVAYNDNPPNKVKRMLMETMLATPGVLTDPPPAVVVTTIDDPLMGYEVKYWVDSYADKPRIHNDFMSRIWYAARRHDVGLPSPAFDLYHYNGPRVNQEAEVTPAKIAAMLNSVETFSMLAPQIIEELSYEATFKEFAVGEVIIGAGDQADGVSVIIRGRAGMTLLSLDGTEHHVEELRSSGVFSEMGLFGRAISPFTVTADEDVELIQIDYEALTAVINRNPQFAAGVDAFVNQRRLAVERLTGSSTIEPGESSALENVNGNAAPLLEGPNSN